MQHLEGNYSYLFIIWQKGEEEFLSERLCKRDDYPNGRNNEKLPKNGSDPQTGIFVLGVV